jgi:two-component system chemotaxis response regulator CheB
MLDDGIAGLAAIKRYGGYTLVQDPKTATYPSMPQQALNKVDIDKIAGIAEIPKIISELVRTGAKSQLVEDKMEERQSKMTCPECRGPLWERHEGRVIEYRCRVGHIYSPLSLKYDHNVTIERSLWSLIVAMEEAAEIAMTLSRESNHSSFIDEAEKRRRQAEILRSMIEEVD